MTINSTPQPSTPGAAVGAPGGMGHPGNGAAGQVGRRLRRWRRGWGGQILGIFALRFAGFATLVAIWALAATQFMAIQLPRPSLAWDALRENFITAEGLELQGLEGGYLTNALYTVKNALLGFTIGSGLGFVVGMLGARLQWVRNASTPLLILFAAVPDLVAAPFFLVWFGPGRTAQMLIVIFYCFVVVGIASQNAALRLVPQYEEYGATLGASGPRRFLTIVVPGALPSTIGAVRIALATSWSLQTAGELLGSQQGVGRVVVLSQQLGFTAGTMAIITLMGAIALVADGLITATLRYISRWQETVSR